jgi:hypothetical protein
MLDFVTTYISNYMASLAPPLIFGLSCVGVLLALGTVAAFILPALQPRRVCDLGGSCARCWWQRFC